MKIVRQWFSFAGRYALWDTLDNIIDQVTHTPDDEAKVAAGALVGLIVWLSIWRGTRSGWLLETAYIVLDALLTVILALIPGPSIARVQCMACGFPPAGKRVFVVRWLLWIFVFKPHDCVPCRIYNKLVLPPG